jgi:hypothetical protein
MSRKRRVGGLAVLAGLGVAIWLLLTRGICGFGGGVGDGDGDVPDASETTQENRLSTPDAGSLALEIEVRGTGVYIDNASVTTPEAVSAAGAAARAGRPVHLRLTSSALEQSVNELRSQLEAANIEIIVIPPR